MFRTIAGILLLTVSLGAYPATSVFWVLGSFSKADNAHAERDRLAAALDVTIEVRFDEERGLFRVVAPADLVPRDALGDRETWRLTIETPDAPVLTATESDTASDNANEDTPPVEDDSPEEVMSPPEENQPSLSVAQPAEPEPLYPPFQERESLSEYCVRLPDTRLCQHPKTQEVLYKDRKLSGYRRPDCDQIIDESRRQTCEEM